MSPGYTPEPCLVALCLRRQIHPDSIDSCKHFLLLASIDRVHIAYPETHLNRHMAFPLHPFHKAKALEDLETTRLNAVCLAFEDFETTEVGPKGLSSSATDTEPDSEQASLLAQYSTSSTTSFQTLEKSNGFLVSHFLIMTVLLSSKRLMSAVYGSFINTTLICAFDSVLPLFVKKTFGWNFTAAGLIFLTIAFPSILGPLAGAIADRFGPRPVALCGFAVATSALALLGLVRNGIVGMQALLGVLLTIVGTLVYFFDPSPDHLQSYGS